MASPSMYITPPSSPSCEIPPQTPTPKKQGVRSPFRGASFGAADEAVVKSWMSEIQPFSKGVHGDFGEDSDGMSPEQVPARENRDPVFQASFLSDLENDAPPQLQVTEDSTTTATDAVAASAAAPVVAQKSFANPLESVKSPRARALQFDGAPAPGQEQPDVVDLNISSIGVRRGPSLNLSMPAPSVRAGKSPARAAPVPSLNLPRSSPSKLHSVSMLVTHTGPGLGCEDESYTLRTRLVKTPRTVATNPFQHSPKSTLGSAKKKSRTAAMQDGRSRYQNDFEERQRIGSGNFSDVYECVHRMDGMTYAVKILKEELSAVRLAKVMREVFALAALPAHENLVRYYGCWTENNRLYIQTELCEAGNLENRLVGQHRFTESQLCDLLRQVLSGLSHIHKAGLCHLDIKPENILITFVKNGVEKDVVYKIGDLGLVMKADLKDDIMQDIEGGDGRYMSPELMEGNPEKLVGNLEKSDVWSLGCTVYALARRKDLPTGGEEYAEIRAGIIRLPENEYSPAFVELLRRLICPDIRKRPSAAHALQEKLLQSGESKKLNSYKKKKRRIKESLVERDKQVALLQLELQMARQRETQLTADLQHTREELESKRNLEAHFAAMCEVMMKTRT